MWKSERARNINVEIGGNGNQETFQICTIGEILNIRALDMKENKTNWRRDRSRGYCEMSLIIDCARSLSKPRGTS